MEMQSINQEDLIRMIGGLDLDEAADSTDRDERVHAMYELYSEGLTLGQVGKAQDPPISRERVRQLFKAYGFSSRPFIQKSQESVDRMYEMRQQGMTLDQIGAAQDPPITGDSVRAVFERRGLPRHNIRRKLATDDENRREEVNRMYGLYQSGVSLEDVGKAQNPPILGTAVHKAFIKFNLPRRKPHETISLKGGQSTIAKSRVTRESATAMHKLYQQGLSMGQVGQMQDPPVSGAWVSRIFKKFGLATRKPHETNKESRHIEDEHA